MSLTPATLVDTLTGEARPSVAEGPRGTERSRSIEWLRSHGLPTARDEAWKYTPLKELMARTVERVSIAADGLDRVLEQGAYRSIDDEIRVVLVDGTFRPDLSTDPADTGLVVAPLDSVEVDAHELDVLLVDPAEQPRVDGFQMLNRGLGEGGVVIFLAPGRVLEQPVHVVHISSGSPEALLVQPRVDIHVAAEAQMTLLESFVADSPTSFVNALSTIVIEEAATLRHYKVQAQAIGSVHLSSITAHQATGSSFKAGAFMFGGSIARQSVDVVAAGDRTTTDLYGLYLPNGSQRMDNVVTVEHAGRNGASNQTYKGVIDDRARGSFSGHIIVDHGTVGTDAHQNNKTLLLDPAAQSDSRPWLEIFADDVACTHGSAIGQLDEESLFYLRSRGIPLDDARAILVGGFINEIVDRLLTDSVRELVLDLVKRQVRSGFTAELGGGH